MSPAIYRTLLRAPGAAVFFLAAAVGRVGIAMTSLGIVWLVHARTGSYATAGLVTGGFAVARRLPGGCDGQRRNGGAGHRGPASTASAAAACGCNAVGGVSRPGMVTQIRPSRRVFRMPATLSGNEVGHDRFHLAPGLARTRRSV